MGVPSIERQATASRTWSGSKVSALFSGSVLGLGMLPPSPEVQAARATTEGSPRSASGIANSRPSGAA